MLTKVCNLRELVSAIPPSKEHPRRFVHESGSTLVDMDKVVVARSFGGQLVQDEETGISNPDVFVELVFDGALCVTTILNENVIAGLPDIIDVVDDFPCKNPFANGRKGN